MYSYTLDGCREKNERQNKDRIHSAASRRLIPDKLKVTISPPKIVKSSKNDYVRADDVHRMQGHDEMSILSEMFMAISWWSIWRWNPSCDLFRRLRGVTSVWSLFAGAPSVTLKAVSRVLTLEGKCAAGTPSPLYFYGCHEFVWPWLHKNTKGQRSQSGGTRS